MSAIRTYRLGARSTIPGHTLAIWVIILLAATLTSGQTASHYEWDLPSGVVPPRVPVSSPMTSERVELGRHLFYNLRLSGNGTQACASCHNQALAFTDGSAQGLGSTGELHARSPMSLINFAYRDALTWVNPSLLTLEEQVLVPMLGTVPIELGLGGNEGRIYAELAGDPVYQRLFPAAFPAVETPVNTANISTALGAFLRSIISFRSPFDRYRFDQDESALSPSAMSGM